MVRHIVAWNYPEGWSEAENAETAQRVKRELEGLRDLIPGIVELRVIIDPLPSGDADVVLSSLFVDEQALIEYQLHPEHRRVSALVDAALRGRRCIDFIESEIQH